MPDHGTNVPIKCSYGTAVTPWVKFKKIVHLIKPWTPLWTWASPSARAQHPLHGHEHTTTEHFEQCTHLGNLVRGDMGEVVLTGQDRRGATGPRAVENEATQIGA